MKLASGFCFGERFNVFLLGRAYSFAPRCAGMDAISLSFHKEMAKEREPRGLIPLGTPQRANDVSLPLHSCLREVLKIQLLRLQVKETCKHESGTDFALAKSFSRLPLFLLKTKFQAGREAKAFAISACRAWWQDLEHNIKNLDVISLG